MTVATAVTVAKGSGITYNPPKPEEAPQEIREAIILGYNILTDTPKYAPSFSGNKLSCTNCHFNSGISESGKNGGLSLEGVGAKYPLYRDRQKYSVDMVLRVSDCFERSMNGVIPPVTSKEMQSVLVYLQWISKDIPIYNDVPWLKTLTLKTDHKGNAEVGRQVFAQNCAICHSTDGAGTMMAPAVFGDNSYNDGAGMGRLATLAAFAFYNMPKGNPNLTEEQAVDVAEFVDSQPRPHFIKK